MVPTKPPRPIISSCTDLSSLWHVGAASFEQGKLREAREADKASVVLDDSRELDLENRRREAFREFEISPTPLVVLGANVPMHAGPAPTFGVIDTLSFEEVTYLRSPIDYRAGFVRRQGRWWLRTLVAGD
jgi:hypothetical protein